MSATPEPGPSLQAELRAEIAAVLDLWPRMGLGEILEGGVLADALLPLFAARVAAIDAQRGTLARYFEQWGSAAPPTRGEWNALVCERDEARAEVKAWVENFRDGFAATERMRIAAEAELAALHSWDGLMTLLDEHWPADIFPMLEDTATRDPGPRINSLIRWVDQQRAELAAMTTKADTYQRMYYAEHGETAAELTALQQRMAAERTQAAAQANLGLATTRELLAELTARIDTDYVMGGGGLDYSTVNGRGDDHE